MISVVVVYNNEQTFREVLLKSLENQTTKFEIIKIDNTKRKFRSAAEALNYGARKTRGKYVMFVHQDVELDSSSWLERIEGIIDSIPNLGVAGVAGMSSKGGTSKERGRGYISDGGHIWDYSNAVDKPEEVQTLDEFLLIVPKNVFAKLQFDEKTFDGWHCYGADYSLAVREIGLKAYVIPAFVYHRTLGLNRKGLLKYQKRLLEKYKYRRIFTTSGEASGLRLKMVSSPLFSLYQSCYERIFPHWTGLLSRELSGCRTVLDLGCGYNSPIRLTNPRTSVGVELFDPYIRESKKKRIHSQYVEADINRLEFEQKAFDAVLCMEVLEYLTKEKGYMLLGKMEKWAKRKVILTTPNGYLDKSIREGNPLQVQRAGWNAKELAKLGFKVFGINGWKKLKILNLTREPFFLREKVLDLSQKITYRFPKEAFQLFCVKEISE